MKAPALLATALVAVNLPAADLRDPHDVARDWNQTVSEARDISTGTLSLTKDLPSSKPLTIESGPPMPAPRTVKQPGLRWNQRNLSPHDAPYGVKRYDWPEGHPFYPPGRRGRPLPPPLHDFQVMPLGGPHH